MGPLRGVVLTASRRVTLDGPQVGGGAGVSGAPGRVRVDASAGVGRGDVDLAGVPGGQGDGRRPGR
jgi:hypothetical protein